MRCDVVCSRDSWYGLTSCAAGTRDNVTSCAAETCFRQRVSLSVVIWILKPSLFSLPQLHGDGVLTLEHLQGAFILLGLGLITATLAIILERISIYHHTKLSDSTTSTSQLNEPNTTNITCTSWLSHHSLTVAATLLFDSAITTSTYWLNHHHTSHPLNHHHTSHTLNHHHISHTLNHHNTTHYLNLDRRHNTT